MNRLFTVIFVLSLVARAAFSGEKDFTKDEAKLRTESVKKHQDLLKVAVGHDVIINIDYADFGFDKEFFALIGGELLPALSAFYRKTCDKNAEMCESIKKINTIEIKLDNARAQTGQSFSEAEKKWTLSLTKQYMSGLQGNVDYKLQEFLHEQKSRKQK